MDKGVNVLKGNHHVSQTGCSILRLLDCYLPRVLSQEVISYLASEKLIDVYPDPTITGMVCDGDSLWVSARGTLSTYHFNSSREKLFLSSEVSSPFSLIHPYPMALIGDNVLVVDLGRHLIQLFNKLGRYVGPWEMFPNEKAAKKPLSLIIQDKEVFVCDRRDDLLRVYSLRGEWKREWKCPYFSSLIPQAMASLPGKIFVAGRGRVIVHSLKGEILNRWNLSIHNPRSMAFLGNHLYMIDGRSVYIYSDEGRFLYRWDITEEISRDFPSEIILPCGIAISNDGRIFINTSDDLRVYSLTI